VILASASPRRAELLAAAGFAFEARPVEIDERPLAAEPADRYVRRLAAEKSAAAAAGLQSSPHDRPVVMAADTVVTIDGTLLGKPEDDDEAREMLRRLSGRTHQVLTGVSLRHGAFEIGRVESTEVLFSTLSEAEIDWYVSTGEGRDKAGAYAIQGLASRFIPRIVGSYSNVVGLPVAAVFELMKELVA
jgi:septum formation protein